MVTEIDGGGGRYGPPGEGRGSRRTRPSIAERGLRKAGRVGHTRGFNRFTGYQASSMVLCYNASDHLLVFDMRLKLAFF